MSDESPASPTSTYVRVEFINVETGKCKQLTLLDNYQSITDALIEFSEEEDISPRLVDIEITAVV